MIAQGFGVRATSSRAAKPKIHKVGQPRPSILRRQVSESRVPTCNLGLWTLPNADVSGLTCSSSASGASTLMLKAAGVCQQVNAHAAKVSSFGCPKRRSLPGNTGEHPFNYAVILAVGTLLSCGHSMSA